MAIYLRIKVKESCQLAFFYKVLITDNWKQSTEYLIKSNFKNQINIQLHRVYQGYMLWLGHMSIFLYQKRYLYTSLYELCPRNVPNICPIKNKLNTLLRWWPNQNTKQKTMEKGWLSTVSLSSQDFSNSTHEIRLGVGDW